MMAQYLFFLILFTAILIHAFLGRAHTPTALEPHPTPLPQGGRGWRRPQCESLQLCIPATRTFVSCLEKLLFH